MLARANDLGILFSCCFCQYSDEDWCSQHLSAYHWYPFTTLNSPCPQFRFRKFIPQSQRILRCEAAPPIICGCEQLDSLDLIALFHKVANISIQYVIFLFLARLASVRFSALVHTRNIKKVGNALYQLK